MTSILICLDAQSAASRPALRPSRMFKVAIHFFGIVEILGKGPPGTKNTWKIRRTKSTTMASLVTINDVNQQMDIGNLNTKPTEETDSGWKKVQSKKSSLNNLSKERLESMRAAMKQTKITVVIRVPQDTEDGYSAAKMHLNTIRELSKQDSNLVVLDSKGTNHVNIHKAFSEEKYKEAFLPREKKLPNGTIQVSVAHHVLSEVENFNKMLLLPFLKKNRVYIHLNQKDGLEHFSAIGVFFGPHPELSWRDDIVEKIEKTMKAEITEEECNKINTTLQKPKIVIAMVPQIISNLKHNKTKSIACPILAMVPVR
jgi:hypothetical protein